MSNLYKEKKKVGGVLFAMFYVVVVDVMLAIFLKL